MRIFHIVSFSVFQILSLVFLVCYLLGALNVYFSDKTNYCAMTYMFEYPQFVKISLPENQQYPQYGLYAYSEGRLTEKTRKMWFDGIPVLFLPGNSGSHMQVRSISSVALRKALDRGYEVHFDFFTISYNEELSGMYGGVLPSQTKFAAACISKILSLYKNNQYTKTVPDSVILIGHSMGGIIAKRLLANPNTINQTKIAITLAAPLEAPVINVDMAMNDYYMITELEWDAFILRDEVVKRRKILLSFGNGPRDFLIPAGLTSSNDSDISALTTAIPGVWVSPDHVSIVWCKQLVMSINKFLFSIINPTSEQIYEDKEIWLSKAKQYFEANRSMTVNDKINKPIVSMIADAFWYEDNRRIYQVSRPEINKTTYLMIRLVSFPQNRFVAIETVNVDEKDWVFGCDAKFTYGTHRYCKQATSLTELSRWTAATTNTGKRKLATVHLHDIKERHPDWTHVVVKVSPTRKPIQLNVDINDLASRQLTIEMPHALSFSKTTIIEETEPNSLYYELILTDFNTISQAYLLYVEPTASCKATQYHVSAEVHIPWAKNQEYYHYFTQQKRSPMKLRLYKTNPNITYGLEPTEQVIVTLLLDPQCTFEISISHSWYHSFGQFFRHYSPILIPYMAGIMLLVARCIILNLHEQGTCVSVHNALISESVKPYYALVFARLGTMLSLSLPFLSFLLENASWKNMELQYFSKSLLILPTYMTALGILHVVVAAIVLVMVFSSQLAHRLLFRIIWRGSTGLAERVASGLQKIPLVVSAALVFSAPISCGAAALAAGASFYAFMISKMYEEYLEDYVYKLMAKIASRICRIFKRSHAKDNVSETDTSLVKADLSKEEVSSTIKEIENTEPTSKEIENEETSHNINTKDDKEKLEITNKKETESNIISVIENKDIVAKENNEVDVTEEAKDCESSNKKKGRRRKNSEDFDNDLSNLNFHMMMFCLWMVVTLVNMPALLTWARNFSFSVALKPDTSYYTGMLMSACSACVWQMEGPRPKLRYYEPLSRLLFTMSVFILALGPFSLSIVNYGVTLMFTTITLQQLFDKELDSTSNPTEDDLNQNINEETQKESESGKKSSSESKRKKFTSSKKEKTVPSTSGSERNDPSSSRTEKNKSNASGSESQDKPDNENSDNIQSPSDDTQKPSDDCECSESRIYNVFRNLREKFSFSEDT